MFLNEGLEKFYDLRANQHKELCQALIEHKLQRFTASGHWVSSDSIKPCFIYRVKPKEGEFPNEDKIRFKDLCESNYSWLIL